MSEPVRVAVCHNSPIVKHGLRDILNSDPEIEICFEISEFEELLDIKYQKERNYVLVCYEDSSNPKFKALREFTELRSDVRLFAILDCENRTLVTRAIECGISGLQCKNNFQPSEFLHAVHMVHMGATSLSQCAMKILRTDPQSIANGKPENLSAREYQVLNLIAKGKSNQDIADNLHISTRTVKFHVSSILAKLKAKNRTEAALRLL